MIVAAARYDSSSHNRLKILIFSLLAIYIQPDLLVAVRRGHVPLEMMTRVEMRKPEMQRIAEQFKRCLMDKKFVGDEVKESRAKFQKVGYSFDGQN